MPVKHDLFQDLGFTKEQVAEHSKTDKQLNHLLQEYNKTDAEVLSAEAGASGSLSDKQLNESKAKRLKIKDQIVQHLKQS